MQPADLARGWLKAVTAMRPRPSASASAGHIGAALKVADSEKAVQVKERDAAIAGLQQTLEKAQEALRETTARYGEATTDLATLRETLDQERRAADEKLKLLNDAQDALTNQF